MFGIGLPELILILAVALIVVGPDKLPDLARTLAKAVVELRKAAGALKDSINDEELSAPTQERPTAPPQISAAFDQLPPAAMPETPDTGSDASAVRDAVEVDTTPSTEHAGDQKPNA